MSLIVSLLPQSTVQALKRRYNIPDVHWSLTNLRSNGFRPGTVIDVGAYEGSWTRLAKDVYPEASVLMVEPQQSQASTLQRVAEQWSDVTYAPSLVGPEQRDETSFYLNETVSSVLPEHEETAATQTTLPMTTLDALTETTPFAEPDFLKLDVQGYELEVLRGAERILSEGSVEAILMEVSLIDINENAPLAADVMRFMDDWNYRLYDICSFFRRPLDDALWQIDALFVHDDSPIVASKRWD